MSDSGVENRSPGTISGRSRGSGGSAVATELVASRKAATQSNLAEKFRHAPIRRLYMRQESPNTVHAFHSGAIVRAGRFIVRELNALRARCGSLFASPRETAI